jgi:Lrp/AsnC family transcriptional regulator, leucine-responsive regulatory protein
MFMKFDAIDQKILNILQANSKITNSQLASEIGTSASGMLDRVKRLEKAGIINKYVALVDPEKAGRGVIALISVSLTAHKSNAFDTFTRQIKKIDEVLECYHTAGEEDFVLKVAVKDIPAYENFILKKLTLIEGVNKIKTNFVLSTVKYNTKIQI